MVVRIEMQRDEREDGQETVMNPLLSLSFILSLSLFHCLLDRHHHLSSCCFDSEDNDRRRKANELFKRGKDEGSRRESKGGDE